MDKSKFWLGGRLFNTASPRLGAPTQPKARPQDGRPNATQGTSASWAPQRNARHVRKLGAPTHVRNANARHATQGTSASWAPQRTSATQTQDTQRKARPHVRKLGAPTQRKACPQDGRPNTKLIRNESVHTREHWAKSRAGGWIRTNFGLEVDFLIRPHGTSATQGTSASWAAQRTSARHVRKLGGPTHVRNANARHVRNLGATTQRKARPQDGRPNAKLINNENVHTREH
jgi:hypothetical protein